MSGGPGVRNASTLRDMTMSRSDVRAAVQYRLARSVDSLPAAGPESMARASSPPSPLWLGWCLVWVVGTLTIGILLLRRREL